MWFWRVYDKLLKYFELKLSPSAKNITKRTTVEKSHLGQHELLNAGHLICVIQLPELDDSAAPI